MEQQISNEINELMNYVKSYNLMLRLYDPEIEFEEDELSTCFKYTLRFDNPDVAIQRTVVYLYRHGDHFLIDIKFKNVTFNGHKMRKKLLKASIENYTKSRNSYGQNCYDIRFHTLTELQNTLECFSEYLPK